MDLKILEVRDGARAESEYVLLEVLKDTSLLGYALLDETYNYKGVSKTHRHLFRFPELSVKKGEQVRVYSGKGKQGTAEADGSNPVTHNFFWGMDECLWNSRRDKAELLWIKSMDKMNVSQ
jgi:hypothetical protein